MSDFNKIEKDNINVLSPFKLLVLQNFPFIEADFDSITNYQLMCKMAEYMNSINTNVNTLNENENRVYNAFNEIVDYINNYFNNLDVQEEINKKLDNMASDGTLTELIENYVNPYINTQNIKIQQIENQVNSAVSGSPLVASSTSEMTDTTRVYVNTTDGKWYYYNGTNWTIGGTYQATALSTNDNNRINDCESELFNVNTIPTIDGFIRADGTISTSSNGKRTDYIEIKDYNKIEYSAYLSTTGYMLAFYDSTKTLMTNDSILGDGTAKTNIKIDVPSGAYYVILSNYGESQPNPYIKLWKNNSNVNKTNYAYDLSEENEDEIDNLYTDLYNINETPSIDGYVNLYGAFTTTSNAKRTDYIKIRNYQKINYNGSISNTGYLLAFFDRDKNIITNISILGDGVAHNETIDVPSSAYYVILSNYGTTVPSPYIKIWKENSNISVFNKLKGKNILIFGDSITSCCDISYNSSEQTTAYSWRNPSNSYVNENSETISYSMWPKILNDNYDCKEIRNYACPGASYTNAERESGNERQNLSFQIELAINDKNNPNSVFNQSSFNPDIIIFALGTNDWTINDTYESAMNKTIYESDNETINVDGTLNNLNLNNFNEAIRYAYLKVKQQWPMAQIFCVLPIQRVTRDVDNVSSIIEKMALRYGAIIINGNGNSGITRELNVKNGLGVYLKDGLHPNEKGQNLLTRIIICSLLSNYIDFTNMN